MTEAGGDFSLDRLVAGIDYDVDVQGPDGRTTSAKSLRPGAQLVLSLPPAKRVCGEVVDAKGVAIRDFEITLFEGRSTRSFRFSNEEGSWCLPEVGRAHKLLVTARGGMVTCAGRGHLVNEFADEVGVRGLILDSEGEGLPGAMLWLVDPASKRRVGGVATSGANGSFDLTAPSDTLLLHVAPPAGLPNVLSHARLVQLARLRICPPNRAANKLHGAGSPLWSLRLWGAVVQANSETRHQTRRPPSPSNNARNSAHCRS